MAYRALLGGLALFIVPGLANAADVPAAGGPATPANAAVPACTNHPPKLNAVPEVRPLIPDLGFTPGARLRVGRWVQIQLIGEDPDGDRLSYRAGPLPAGATFDEETGTLKWKPTLDQEGKHELQVEVSDGQLVTKRNFQFLVAPNRAPASVTEEPILLRARSRSFLGSGRRHRSGIPVTVALASDPDSDKITLRVREAPAGARIFANDGAVSLDWAPEPKDVGEYQLLFDVSDGELTTSVGVKVVVFPEWGASDYHRYLLLGGGPSGFISHVSGESFFGGSFDVTLVAVREALISGYRCEHGQKEAECHASHHRFYGQFEVLASSRGGSSLFSYGFGYSASLEWAPRRRYLIPLYGLEVGGILRSGLGHRAQTRPYLGLHLFAGDEVWLDATLGYRVVPAELRDLSGPTFALAAIINPW